MSDLSPQSGRKDKRMRKILLTGVAALLMAISAHATENPDMCAVVLKTPDGFLALRTKPEPKSKMMSKLFPGQVLRVDIDKYRSKNWIYVEGLVENSERLDGWVYSKYIQSFVCPISGEAATGAQKSLLPSHPTRQNEADALGIGASTKNVFQVHGVDAAEKLVLNASSSRMPSWRASRVVRGVAKELPARLEPVIRTPERNS